MKLGEFLLPLSCLALYMSVPSHGNPLELSNVPNKLFYIMLDGFRYDYVDMQSAKDLPGFTKFLKEGVKSDWMTPIFPSISYPDWTTLVTGLWAESHGVVGNYMYNAVTENVFELGQPNTTGIESWWTAEPIWITATKAGLKSGIIRWSRCDIAYNGILPEHCDPFDINESDRDYFTNNTEKALTLLENGYDLVMLYSPYIDNLGHSSGPETEDMIEAVQFMDRHILYILTELEERNLDDKVNIIIVSDHGMKDISPGPTKHIELSNFINETQIEKIVDVGAFCIIKTQSGQTEQVYHDLKEINGIDVYLKENIPNRYHFKNHDLIHDILIVAKDGYFIQGIHGDKHLPKRDDISSAGAHGFDPLEEKMRAIFFAKGPDFQENKVIPAIQNVDVYPLLAHLMKIDPLPNNGTFLHTQDALLYPKTTKIEFYGLINKFADFVRNN